MPQRNRARHDLRLPRRRAACSASHHPRRQRSPARASDVSQSFPRNRPEKWNASEINGWWSGFLPNTRDNHCAYTNAQAAYYLLVDPALSRKRQEVALRVLDTAVELQRDDGAFGYIFSSTERRV